MFAVLSVMDAIVYVFVPIGLLLGFAWLIISRYAPAREEIPLGRIRRSVSDWVREVARFHKQFNMKDLWSSKAGAYKCVWAKEFIELRTDAKHQKLYINIRGEGLLELFFADSELLSLKFGGFDLKNEATKPYRKSAWALLQEVRNKVGLPPERRGSSTDTYLKTLQGGGRPQPKK